MDNKYLYLSTISIYSCVKKIIDREPCLITYPAKNGNAALHLAAEKGNERILRLLLDSVSALELSVTVISSMMDQVVEYTKMQL